MRKGIALVLAVLLLAGCALADGVVLLPESRYAVTLPDGMEYDGPTEGSAEAFAYVSEELGLEMQFYRFENPDGNLTSLIASLLEKGAEDIGVTAAGKTEMLVFRLPPADGDGMKSIGYILQDGGAAQMIVFWYATQEAADLAKTIMESIGETETV